MALPLTAPYVVGLLYNLSRAEVRVGAALAAGQAQARAGQTALDAAASALRSTEQAIRTLQAEQLLSARQVGDANGRLANLHREVGVLQRRVDGLREAMLASQGIEQQQLRRSRAAVQLQLNAQRELLTGITRDLDGLHASQTRQQLALALALDRARTEGASLDGLQAQLPAPELYLELFAATAAQAHCQMFLDRDPEAWRGALLRALEPMQALQAAVGAGHYRLAQNSELLGGRHPWVGDAVYAAVAMNADPLALALFRRSTDPTLLFHHILPVFRLWCMGLSLQGRQAELEPLLRTHMYADGLRGAYANAFLALGQGDSLRFERQLRRLVQLEWRLAPSTPQPALAVVGVGGLALARLAQRRGLLATGLDLGPTVPSELLLARFVGPVLAPAPAAAT